MATSSEPNRLPSARRIRRRTDRALRVRPTPDTNATVERVLALLTATGLSRDAALEVLGAAFMHTAVAPYWTTPQEAPESHAALAAEEPDLAEAVEALAPWLLGRSERRDAIVAVEELLRT